LRLLNESIGDKTTKTYASSIKQFARWLQDATRKDVEPYKWIRGDGEGLHYEPVDGFNVDTYPKMVATALEHYVQYVCSDAMKIQTHLRNIHTNRAYRQGTPGFLSTNYGGNGVTKGGNKVVTAKY